MKTSLVKTNPVMIFAVQYNKVLPAYFTLFLLRIAIIMQIRWDI